LQSERLKLHVDVIAHTSILNNRAVR